MRAIARRTVVLAAALLTLAACNKGAGGTDMTQDRSLGKADAPVTVLEYASPTCPHCAAWNADVFPAFKTKYVDSGQVKYVLREAPIHGAVDAAAFLLARCVTSDKYFAVIDAVMRSQQEMFETRNPMAVLTRIGQSSGLSEQQVKDCIGDDAKTKAMAERVDREMKEFDVQSTPTFVVNGKKMETEHPPSMEELSAVIDPLLSAKKK
jgi:protein-disulfide isomerase